MSTGLGQLTYAEGRRSELRRVGYRVTITQRGTSGKSWDVTNAVQGLRYSSRLPGGFADCTFTVAAGFGETRDMLQPGRRVDVWFRDELAWQGLIYEPPRGVRGGEAIPVAALGPSAELRARKFRKIFVERGYGRWKAGSELSPSYPNSTVPSAGSPVFPPGYNGAAAAITFGQNQTFATTDDAALIYSAPPGCEILRVKGTWKGIGGTVNVTGKLDAFTSSVGAFSSAGDQTIVAARLVSAGDTTFDVTLTNASQYLRLHADQTSAGYVPGADQSVAVTDMRIVGARTAEGAVFDPDGVTTIGAIRALLAEFGGGVVSSSTERMRFTDPRLQSDNVYYDNAFPAWRGDPLAAWDVLAFTEETTVEDAINFMNQALGWEWGVFEDGLFYLAPLEAFLGRDYGPGSATVQPDSFLVVESGGGARFNIAETIAEVRNRVYVKYTTPGGIAGLAQANRLGDPTNPLNIAGLVREEYIDAGTCTAAEAQQVADAYLTTFGRPQLRGDIVLSDTQAATTLRVNSTPGTKQTPCLRPGEWVLLPDALEGLYERGVIGGMGYQTQGAPADLRGFSVPVRAVTVDAAAGTVALSVDNSRNDFKVLMSRLAQARG